MQPLVFELLSVRPKTGAPLGSGPDLREFLFTAALHRRKQLPAHTAAIAGSAGKTTVKEMLGSILKLQCHTHISPANQNTKLALALQILRLPSDTRFAAFEIGARHVGDFQIPLSFVAPQVVTLLNVGTAHAGEFGSRENLIQEKLSILETPHSTTLVVFGDDPRILEKARAQNKKILSFGYFPWNDLQILSDNSAGISIKLQDKILHIECSHPAPQKALNLAAASATAFAMGLSTDDILAGLKAFKGVGRRFQSFNWSGRQAIDDAFNASPESMKEGLRYLSTLQGSKNLLLVLGSMLELGEFSEQEHRSLGSFLVEIFSDAFAKNSLKLVTIGAEAEVIFKTVSEKTDREHLRHFRNSAEAKDVVKVLAKASDLVYFKASKGIQLQHIFGAHE